MSRENIVRFMNRIVTDEAFGEKIGQLEGDGGPESVRRLIEVASVAGYTFTEAELDDLFMGMVKSAAGELGDEQLEGVAGGATSEDLQYLSLQTKMQDSTAGFSLLSNVLKTKHDTAKNAISTFR
jgi:predicted ribosomally synthesized peptide with nif11-like leader